MGEFWGRYLSTNEGNSLPTHCGFLDTETAPVGGNELIHGLHFGIVDLWKYRPITSKWTQQRNGRCLFTTPDELFDHLDACMRSRTTLYLFGHNMGGFDFMAAGLVGALKGRGWKVHTFICGPRPFIVHASDDQGRHLYILDSMNYFVTSIAALGKSVGQEKGTDAGMFASVSEREPYCQTDVDILREVMLRLIEFCREHNLGNWALTAAGLGLNAFRHLFLPEINRIYGGLLLVRDPKVVEIEREAYVGARTELFRKGRYSGVAMADRTSMYPTEMSEQLFPVAVHRAPRFMSVGTLRTLTYSPDGVIARVTVRTEVPCVPKRHGGRLTFPVGEFSTTLTSPELRLAFERGEVVKVEKGGVLVYKMAPIFKEYVNYFWTLRARYLAEGNQLYADLCKVGFLNSLYGKWGQRDPEYRDATKEEKEEFAGVHGQITRIDGTGKMVTVRGYGGVTLVRVAEGERGEARMSMCAIAAFVTAYARVALWEQAIEPNLSTAVMCDTDSICVVGGLEKFGDRLAKKDASGGYVKELGNWVPEQEGLLHSIETNGLKDYKKFDAEGNLLVWKRKGVNTKKLASPEEHELMTPDQRLGVTVLHSDGTTTSRQAVSLNSTLFKGGDPTVVTWKEVTKRYSGFYSKGVVLDDGCIRPLRFTENVCGDLDQNGKVVHGGACSRCAA